MKRAEALLGASTWRFMSLALGVVALLASAESDAGQMNAGVTYLLSNAAPGHERRGRGFVGEWFEVYSPPIRSRYSEVFWKVMDPVALPKDVVARYSNGSVAMGVTGWEVDVVRRGPQGDVSVPCYESYNHHYTSRILGSEAVVSDHMGEDMGHGSEPALALAPGVDQLASMRGGGGGRPVPKAQAFNEHNGNEHRQSYHGLPNGIVQPIMRPNRWIFNPMQINTRNPDGSGRPGGPLPRAAYSPPNASYSGLLECPCGTRFERTPAKGGKPGEINGRPFYNDCRPEPWSSLLRDRNPTCEVETYMGGIQCCYDGAVLLDADQEIPPEVDEIYFKWRFYYVDFEPSKHVAAVHLEWALNGCDSGGPAGNPHNCRRIEYDVPAAPRGTPPEDAVHVVKSRWQVRDMLRSGCDPLLDPYCADPAFAADGLLLIMAGAHCHAPACIDMELRNADSGELLCVIRASSGESERAMDERSYMWMPPCQWGSSDEGLRAPPLLRLDTNLTSTKRANSTNGHPGVMAIWQMRAVYASEAIARGSGSAASLPPSAPARRRPSIFV